MVDNFWPVHQHFNHRTLDPRKIHVDVMCRLQVQPDPVSGRDDVGAHERNFNSSHNRHGNSIFCLRGPVYPGNAARHGAHQRKATRGSKTENDFRQIAGENALLEVIVGAFLDPVVLVVLQPVKLM